MLEPLAPPAATRRRGVRLRRTARFVTVAVTGALLLGATLAGPDRHPAVTPRAAATGAGLVLVSSGGTHHSWKGHPGRWVRHYRVRSGDTATGLAVRFHAWTDELLAINHLSPRSTLYVGERLRIPVVVAAVRRARHHHKATHHHARHRKPKHHKAAHHQRHHHATHHTPKHHPAKRHHTTKHRTSGWVHDDASRATVRRVVAHVAQRRDVSTSLALAIAWQESGWQQHRLSSAGAVGVMQVMPATGRGLEQYLHRRLNLRNLYDKVNAGVLLLHELDATSGTRYTVAGYYQGLGSVRSRGMYPSTKQYVRSVLTIRDRLRAGWDPLD